VRQGARSENILYGSLNDEQRGRTAKDPQPCGLTLAGRWRRCFSVTDHRLCSFVAPCQPRRQSLAHPFSIYEMGSSTS
jgi:hypothetical protein